MKNAKQIIVCCLLFFTLLAASCSSSKPVVLENKTETTKVVTETVHDTIFKIEKDLSSYKALMDCVNGKVKIKEVVQSKAGYNMPSPKVTVRDNYITVDCESRAQELFLQWKSKYIQETTNKTTPIKVYELTFWQEFQIKGFQTLILLITIWLIVQLLKLYFKYENRIFQK